MQKQNTYIIAEIGVNHNGSLSLAKKMIQEAKKCGANAVKFQTFIADKLANKNTPKVKYQKINTKKKETHYQMLKKLELSQEETRYLFNFAKKKNIEFISTPYDVESAEYLFNLGVKVFKTASADISDYFLHNYLSKTKRNIIISTGMSDLSDIEKCLKIYPTKMKKKISLLHCVSNYPCSLSSLNLNSIDVMKKKFDMNIGFSDHTIGSFAAIVAVSKNAKIIEKHFTLNKKLKGPDHSTSMEPKEFSKFVKEIRKAETVLGKNIKKCQIEEKEMKKVSVKGIIVKKNLKKNTIIKLDHLELQRPNFDYTGFDIKKIINKKLKIDLKKFQHIRKKHLN